MTHLCNIFAMKMHSQPFRDKNPLDSNSTWKHTSVTCSNDSTKHHTTNLALILSLWRNPLHSHCNPATECWFLNLLSNICAFQKKKQNIRCDGWIIYQMYVSLAWLAAGKDPGVNVTCKHHRKFNVQSHDLPVCFMWEE